MMHSRNSHYVLSYAIFFFPSLVPNVNLNQQIQQKQPNKQTKETSAAKKKEKSRK